MTREQKLALIENRIKTMEQSVKNIKCQGALKALKREYRNLSK